MAIFKLCDENIARRVIRCEFAACGLPLALIATETLGRGEI